MALPLAELVAEQQEKLPYASWERAVVALPVCECKARLFLVTVCNGYLPSSGRV